MTLEYNEIKDWYERYGPMVFRRCNQMLKDDQRAKDAMQDVFVKVLTARQKLENTSPSSLLYQTATNTCLNLIRSQKRHPESSEEGLLERIVQSVDYEEGHSAREVLTKLFQREKPSTQLIATLHLLDGFTLEEVAKEVGMSLSGVRKRLRNLKTSLKELEGAV